MKAGLSDKDNVLAHYKNSGEPTPVCTKDPASYGTHWTSYTVRSGRKIIGRAGNAGAAWERAAATLDRAHNITRDNPNSEFERGLHYLGRAAECLGEAGIYGQGDDIYIDLLQLLHKHGISVAQDE